jgi:serine/threonine protein kinase
MHIQISDTYNQYSAHKSLCEDLQILHRDISFSNLLLTRPSSTQLAVGLLIDFDYAQHLQDASEETVATGESSSNTRTSAESSCILIPSPNVTASAAGSPQAISMPDMNNASTGHTATSDIGRGIAGNLRTVSLIFF